MDNAIIEEYFGEFEEYKEKSVIVAKLCQKSPNLSGKSYLLHSCNNVFAVFDDGTVYGNYCRQRICPMCQRRLSLKTFALLQKVVKLIPFDKYLLLTLTVRNVNNYEINPTIDRMNKAFSEMWNGFFKYHFNGCFRALEITYNSEMQTFHPHFHAILTAPENYFISDLYVSQPQILEIWRGLYGGGLDGGADIRKIDDIFGGVAEVAKYAVKPFDLKNEDISLFVLNELYTRLRGRRLTQSYGNIRKALKFIKAEYKADESRKTLETDAHKWYRYDFDKGAYYCCGQTT